MTLYSAPRSIESWGRVARGHHRIATPFFRDIVSTCLSDREGDATLPVGLGRSYGDTALNSGGRLIEMTRLGRLIAFDRDTGRLTAEAGTSLSDILRVTVPSGWFLATVPGTRFVTLGAAVANDVHGKNHHGAGSFGCSVSEIELRRSDGSRRVLRASDPLFAAAAGGLGLTGVIETVSVGLRRIGGSSLDVERIRFGHVREFFELAKEAAKTHEHTVAWVDCASGRQRLGRGIFQRANWRQDGRFDLHCEEPRLSVPVDLPAVLMNRLTVRLFNILYYRLQGSSATKNCVHYEPFLFPLDAIGRWNRLYGRRGFFQYQCVVPPAVAPAAVEELLRQIAQSGEGSFLAVLKTLGDRPPPGLLSFARAGTTLALDFPNKGARTLSLLARLDSVTCEAGGAVYPAKDGRMPARTFQAGYPRWREFAALTDPALSSDFWKRVSAC